MCNILFPPMAHASVEFDSVAANTRLRRAPTRQGSNFDHAVLADDDIVIDDDGDPGDDSFQSERAEHALARVIGKGVTVRPGADAEVHGPVAFFVAAHDAGAGRTLFVGSQSHLAAYGVGILVAVLFQIGLNLLRFETAGEPFEARRPDPIRVASPTQGSKAP